MRAAAERLGDALIALADVIVDKLRLVELVVRLSTWIRGEWPVRLAWFLTGTGIGALISDLAGR